MDSLKLPFKIGSFVMLLWGGAMLLPLLVSGGDLVQMGSFILSAACCFALSLTFTGLSRGYRVSMEARPLFLTTALNWLFLSFTGTFPYLFSEMPLTFTDALFESVSGITTTGSTVLSGLDNLPRSILLWRSITQWVGGIGIILMAVAILPYLKVGGMRLFKTESSEWAQLDSGHIYKAAKYISLTYAVITLLCAFTYGLLGMSWFDAVNHSLTTVSTGGYSTSDLSFAKYPGPAMLVAACVFMVLGGCPFFLYIKSLQQRSLVILRDSQVRLFLKLVLVMVFAVSLQRLLSNPGLDVLQTVTNSAFNIISLITTTGYASQDYSTWGAFPVLVLFFLMFSGACSGSTSGGIKLFRFQLLMIYAVEHLFNAVHPKCVRAREYNNRPVNEEVLVSSIAFFFFVIVSWSVFSVLLGAFGVDPVTSVTGALTALMNVGPGFGEIIGPAGNFSTLPDPAKYLLCMAMLLGRLEYLALVVIFTRAFWEW